MLTVSQIHLYPQEDGEQLKIKIADKLRVSPQEIRSVSVLHKSLDARKKNDLFFEIQAAVCLDRNTENRILKKRYSFVAEAEQQEEQPLKVGRKALNGRPVIVGFGPSGIFAGYLLSKMGYRPLIIERGGSMEERVSSVDTFWACGDLDEECNVMFGEGGAGTFSDGKLTSRSKDPRGRKVTEILAAHGAEDEIRYLNKPHIGTDRLRAIVVALRHSIISLGGEILFNTKLTGIDFHDGRIRSVIVMHQGIETVLDTEQVILAIGQGARDTYRMLLDRGIAMAPKPFAVGVRAEHPQSLINRIQYGREIPPSGLGAAEYKLTANSGGRGVYSFCMCPGGYVVASSSSRGQVCVNGMSNSKRDGQNANSAIVVQVRTEDLEKTGPLAGVDFCESMERRAFLAGGGNYRAPASLLNDFLLRRTSKGPGSVIPTYRPGVEWASLWDVLPPFVAESIAGGFASFGRSMRGYDDGDVVLTAPETRTSAPVRILRDEGMESLTCKGLYPVGEGAGYAGGIISAAIDGLHAAEMVIEKYAPLAE